MRNGGSSSRRMRRFNPDLCSFVESKKAVFETQERGTGGGVPQLRVKVDFSLQTRSNEPLLLCHFLPAAAAPQVQVGCVVMAVAL